MLGLRLAKFDNVDLLKRVIGRQRGEGDMAGVDKWHVIYIYIMKELLEGEQPCRGDYLRLCWCFLEI